MAFTWTSQPLQHITVLGPDLTTPNYRVQVRTVWRRSDGQDINIVGEYVIEPGDFSGSEPVGTIMAGLETDWASLLV